MKFTCLYFPRSSEASFEGETTTIKATLLVYVTAWVWFRRTASKEIEGQNDTKKLKERKGVLWILTKINLKSSTVNTKLFSGLKKKNEKFNNQKRKVYLALFVVVSTIIFCSNFSQPPRRRSLILENPEFPKKPYWEQIIYVGYH